MLSIVRNKRNYRLCANYTYLNRSEFGGSGSFGPLSFPNDPAKAAQVREGHDLRAAPEYEGDAGGTQEEVDQ